GPALRLSGRNARPARQHPPPALSRLRERWPRRTRARRRLQRTGHSHEFFVAIARVNAIEQAGGVAGLDELVRGAVFNELDTRALRADVIAAGNDPLVSNRPGGIPTTVISPSLLFDELEVKRADTSKDKLPEYPPPPLKK